MNQTRRKQLPNPHLSIWRTLLASLYLNALFTFFSWLFKLLKEPDRYSGFRSIPPSFPPLNTEDILLGSGFWLLYLWLYWAWHPKRKHGKWHRWLGSLATGVYLSVLVLSGGVTFWNTLLIPPWNWIVNGSLLTLLFFAWALPALSHRWSQRIVKAQDTLSIRILGCGGIGGLMVLAGIWGASFGMSASRHGNERLVHLLMAFSWPLLAVFLAQYNAERLWRFRPWAKEGEE